MIVTRSTIKNLPIKFDLLGGHCRYKRVLWPIGADIVKVNCKGDGFVNYTLDSYIMAEVSFSAYGLYQMRCYEKAYHMMDQYDPLLVLCQGFRMHYCSSCQA